MALGTLAFLILALAVLYLPQQPLSVPRRETRVPLLLLASVLVVYLIQFHFGEGNPALGEPWKLAIGVAIAGAAWLCWARSHNAIAVLSFIALVVFIAVQDIHALSYDALPAMLHLVFKANQSLSAGLNPYVSPGINYFPALWLPYFPVIGAGIDPRVLNLTLFVLLGVILFWASQRLFLPHAPYYYRLALTTCAILLLNPGIILEGMKDQVLVDWVYVTIAALGLLMGMPRWSSVGFGLSFAARQTSLVLIPVVFLEFHRRFAKGLAWFVFAMVIAAAILVPFLLANPFAFVDWTFLYNQRWFIDRWIQDQAQARAISFSAIFFITGLEYLLQPIQIVLVLMLSALYAIVPSSTVSVTVRRCALVYFIFLLFNPVIWNYYYVQFLLLTIVFLFSRLRETMSTEGQG